MRCWCGPGVVSFRCVSELRYGGSSVRLVAASSWVIRWLPKLPIEDAELLVVGNQGQSRRVCSDGSQLARGWRGSFDHNLIWPLSYTSCTGRTNQGALDSSPPPNRVAPRADFMHQGQQYDRRPDERNHDGQPTHGVHDGEIRRVRSNSQSHVVNDCPSRRARRAPEVHADQGWARLVCERSRRARAPAASPGPFRTRRLACRLVHKRVGASVPLPPGLTAPRHCPRVQAETGRTTVVACGVET
jgi:hypothetical protein